MKEAIFLGVAVIVLVTTFAPTRSLAPRKQAAKRAMIPGTSGHILNLFAGVGGWDVALARLGLQSLGIELDPYACATARAAGHERLQADVAELDPLHFEPVWGLVGSPPCQAYSAAGERLGYADKPIVIACARELAAGNDSRRARCGECHDTRSLLTIEPLRYILALRPRWVALEQVPSVLELWNVFANLLADYGYQSATKILSAERYGVPQTRRRAFLIASLDGPVGLPVPTHRSYDPGRSGVSELPGLALEPWVSMARALGWTREQEGWMWRNGGRRDAAIRASTEPALTIHFGHDASRTGWINGANVLRRVTVSEAAILQGFPADYPWQGAKRRQFEQVANAVPPPLAHRVLQEALCGGDAAL